MRKHAFPISQPNLRVIDNDVVNSLGDGVDFSAGGHFTNEDGNVSWLVSLLDGTLRGAYLFLDKKDREVLIDFTQNPSDVYSGILPTDAADPPLFVLVFGPWWKSGVLGGLVNVGDNIDMRLEVGSVFCVGVKNKTELHTVRAYLLYTTMADASDQEYPFRSGSVVVPPTSNAEMGVGSWLTFMFDGKRLVFLGSNNWV